MQNISLRILLSAYVFLFSNALQAAPVTINKTMMGAEFGVLGSGTNKPLAIIFTTSIEESLNDVFTTLGSDLLKAGFLVASLDVPCHGRDIKPREPGGLDCWRTRIAGGDAATFERFSKKVGDVITELVSKGRAHPQQIIAIGVSRGGYVALQAAARNPGIQYVVALSPVTNLQKLNEFAGMNVNQDQFGFARYYSALAQQHIFLQIGNDDDRVGTKDTIQLGEKIIESGKVGAVDLSTYIMPFKGHGTPKDKLAFDWIIERIKNTSTTSLRPKVAP